MTSLEEKLDKLRLEYLSHGALVVKRPSWRNSSDVNSSSFVPTKPRDLQSTSVASTADYRERMTWAVVGVLDVEIENRPY